MFKENNGANKADSVNLMAPLCVFSIWNFHDITIIYNK